MKCQCRSEFFKGLVTAVEISESTKAYKSNEKQSRNNKSGKDLRKRIMSLNANGRSIKMGMIGGPRILCDRCIGQY